MTIESISISKGYLIVSMVFSCIVIVVYGIISYFISKKVLNGSRPIILLRMAFCIWLLMIILQILQVIFLNVLLIPQISDCKDGQCNYCEVFGRLEKLIIAIKRILKILLLLQAIKYVSKFGYFLISLKALMISICIAFMIFALQSEMNVFRINNDPNWIVCSSCGHYLAHEVVMFLLVLGGFTLWLTSISSAVITWKQCNSIDFYKYTALQIKDVEYKLKLSIKNCVLSTQILVINAALKVILWQSFTKDLSFHSNPFIELLDGICIYMLFDFGDTLYYTVYGCIHYRIMDHWEERHRVAIEIMYKDEFLTKMSQSSSKQRRNSISGKLSSIDETKSTTESIEPEQIAEKPKDSPIVKGHSVSSSWSSSPSESIELQI